MTQMKPTPAPDLRLLQGYAISAAHALLSGRWRLPIVVVLMKGPARFSDLRRAIPKVSARILTNKLRQLETDGIILQDAVATTRRRYALTRFGEALQPALNALAHWAGGRPQSGGKTAAADLLATGTEVK